VRITWLGHASVLLESDGTRLLFDPVLGHRVAHLRRRFGVPAEHVEHIDAVCCSHAHHDHLDLATLRRIRRASPDAEWHAPRGAARVLERAAFSPIVRREVGDDVRIGALRVESVPAAHGGERLPWSRDEAGAEAVGFVVTTEAGLRVWFAGDTSYDDVLEGVGQVDVALVPIGGWWRTLGPGHMDPAHAAKAVELVGARVAIPIHWGTYHPIGLFRAMRAMWDSPAIEFREGVASNVDVRVLRVGEGTDIELPPTREDAPT
jgi:L-ascorbate metabolism protein UlaG (beta-lactamase superfamily)